MSTVRPSSEATRGGPDLFDLTGRVAPVTGAARGIGQSIAVELARRGAHVVVADMRHPSETVAPLRGGFSVRTHEGNAVDVREREQVENAVFDTVKRFGRLDILVNNSGTATWASLTGITDDEWFRDFDISPRGTFLFCRAAISPWRSEQRAVIALTTWLTQVVGALGLTVNSVAPGPIATTLTDNVAYDFSQQIIPRMGRPAKIGAAVAYPAPPATAYVTGQVLRVCGGAALG